MWTNKALITRRPGIFFSQHGHMSRLQLKVLQKNHGNSNSIKSDEIEVFNHHVVELCLLLIIPIIAFGEGTFN
jgi:hypothetical protein